MAIASFVLLGDSQLVIKAASALKPQLPEVDYLITAEAKGIPLVQELARLLGMDRYFVARKSIKPYMGQSLRHRSVFHYDPEEADSLPG